MTARLVLVFAGLDAGAQAVASDVFRGVLPEGLPADGFAATGESYPTPVVKRHNTYISP